MNPVATCANRSMQVLPLVSISIPCFNQKEFVVEAVSSALSQTYPNLEVIVSDDASTDGTAQLADTWNFDDLVRYYRNETNVGRVANYRLAINERARGKYVLNLDGDDLLLCNDYIANAVNLMEAHNLSLVFGRRVAFGTEHSCEKGEFKIFDRNFLDYYLSSGMPVPHLSTLYDRNLAIKLDFYCFDIISSDRHSVLNLAFDHKVGYMNQVAGAWRFTGRNISRTDDVKSRVENISLPILVEQSIRARTNDPIELKSWVRQYCGQIMANYLLMYLKSGNAKNIFRYLYSVTRSYSVELQIHGLKALFIKCLRKFKVT